MHTLSEAIQTNLILFTSTGLWGLTINNRYTHTIGRLREFYDKQCNKDEISRIETRCYVLKMSYVSLIISVLIGIVYAMGSAIFESSQYLNATAIAYCISLFTSMACLLIDVIQSLSATVWHVHNKN